MHALIQGVLLGVLTGGVYALMASGQTLIFGIMKVINLAQGAMVILAAYLAYQLFVSFGVDPFLAIPVTTALMFALGVGVQVAFLRPLRREDKVELSLLVTFAVALLIEGGMSVTWKTTHRSINTGYANDSWTLFGYQITVVRFWAFVLSLAALGVLVLLLHRPRFGRAVRATVQNPDAALLLGVGGLLALPLLGFEHWVLNLLVFVLISAVLSSAWNLVGGFAGSPSLGHAAFFGIGAYALGFVFRHQQHLANGYEPFLWLPLIGLLGAVIGVPIAAVAMRTRADVFAIVTITL